MDELILQATLDVIDAGDPVTVARIIERGGLNRAAIYRHWSSLTDLVAAALDRGRHTPAPLRPGGNVREQIVDMIMGDADSAAMQSEARVRQRIALAMSDRALQWSYWRSHVTRRRSVVESAIRTAIERGFLRADVDPEVAFDLLAGVAYYQVVVRGDWLSKPATRQRCREAMDIVWRGLEA